MSRRLRILHIGNGRAFKIHAILRGLLARGHEIHMVPIPPSTGGMEGVVWHVLEDSPLPGRAGILHSMFRLRRLVARLNPDIIHAHNAWGPGWYGAFAGRHPYVIHAYGGDFLPEQYAGKPAFQKWLTGWACRSADRIIVTGRHMREASRHLRIDPSRVHVLPRGVDISHFRGGRDTAALRGRLGIAPGAPVVLSPRYQANESLYNLDVVLEAFAQVRVERPDAVCLQFFGADHGAGAARLRALADGKGLGDSYRLVPAVGNDAMADYFNLAAVTVSVPSSDGFPVTVLEASACECPLVVSDLAYTREWFVSGRNGLVVPARDPRRTAEAVLAILRDPQAAERMGAAGRELVVRDADYEWCMDLLQEGYIELLERRAGRRGRES